MKKVLISILLLAISFGVQANPAYHYNNDPAALANQLMTMPDTAVVAPVYKLEDGKTVNGMTPYAPPAINGEYMMAPVPLDHPYYQNTFIAELVDGVIRQRLTLTVKPLSQRGTIEEQIAAAHGQDWTKLGQDNLNKLPVCKWPNQYLYDLYQDSWTQGNPNAQVDSSKPICYFNKTYTNYIPNVIETNPWAE